MNIAALSQSAAAALLSVTPRSLRDWEKAGTLPRNSDGTYSGPALVAWYVERKTGGEFDDHRDRLAAAQAERVEMDNALRRLELAEISDVVRFWSDCIANARARALAMPSKLSSRLVNVSDANTIDAAIRAEIHALLGELSEYEPPAGEPGRAPPEDTERLAPATRANGKPMGGRKPAPVERVERGAR